MNFLTIFKFADDNPDFLCIIVEKKMFFSKTVGSRRALPALWRGGAQRIREKRLGNGKD